MTLQKSSRKGVHNAPLSYFAFLLRQNWPAFVTNLIILLLVNVVVLSMALSNDSIFYGEQTYNVLLVNAVGYAEAYRIANIIIGALLAVLWGSGTMTYVNSKVSVHFYHSIPLTRGTLYLSEILVKVICYALPAFVTSGLSVCVIGMNTGIWHPTVTEILLSGGLYAILYFVFYLSIMVFAASFTGNAFSRLMTAGLVVAMPSALILFWTTILQYNSVYTSYDSLYGLALELFTPARIIASFADNVFSDEVFTYISRGWETVGTLIASALFFFAGYLIYRRRRSEQSGLPVLSKIASALIKYTCMFCAAAAFGYVFELFGDGAVSYCIGAVIGALLAMMLINVILTKSAKQIFAGLPAMGIFSAAFVVMFILFGVDVIGHDRYIPSASAIRELTLSVGSEVELTITDEEAQEYYTDLIRTYLQADGDADSPGADAVEIAMEIPASEDIMTDEEYEIWQKEFLDSIKNDLICTKRYFTLSVEIKPMFGITTRKYFNADREEFAEFLDRMTEEEQFAAAYFPEVSREDVMLENARVDCLYYENEQLYDNDAVWDIIDKLKAEFNGKEYFQRSTVASLYYRGTMKEPQQEGNWTSSLCTFRLPYYGANDTYLEQNMARIGAVYVLDRETNEMRMYTDADEMRAICGNLCYSGMSRYHSVFTDTDSRYAVAVAVTEAEDKYEYGIQSYDIAFFIEGMVPAFVK